jgi:hypothetical protein
MNGKALCGATVAGLIGAVLWYLINQDLDSRYVIAAWGMGALVGGAGVFCGGRGDAFAFCCAAITVVAIIVGELAVASSWVNRALEESATMEFIEIAADAEAYESVEGETERRRFLVRRGYSEAAEASQVSDEELEYFETEIVPLFEQIRSGELDSQSWAEQRAGDVSVVSVAWQSLGPLEGIFGLLGLATAIFIVKKYGEE